MVKTPSSIYEVRALTTGLVSSRFSSFSAEAAASRRMRSRVFQTCGWTVGMALLRFRGGGPGGLPIRLAPWSSEDRIAVTPARGDVHQHAAIQRQRRAGDKISFVGSEEQLGVGDDPGSALYALQGYAPPGPAGCHIQRCGSTVAIIPPFATWKATLEILHAEIDEIIRITPKFCSRMIGSVAMGHSVHGRGFKDLRPRWFFGSANVTSVIDGAQVSGPAGRGQSR